MFNLVQDSWFVGHWAVFTLLIVLSLFVTGIFVGIKVYKYFKRESF